METWQAKLIVLFSMFLIAFVSGIVPIKLVDVIRGRRRGERRHHHRKSSATSSGANAAVDADHPEERSRQSSDDVDAETAAGPPRLTVPRNSCSYSSLSSLESKAAEVDDLLVVGGGVVTCSRTTADRVLDMLNCFAGGVFLATSLLHLLPDVRKDLDKVFSESGWEPVDFPLPEFITSIGFFFVMTVEQVPDR